MLITKAVAADIPALSDLLYALFSQEAEFEPDPEAQSRGLARIIADSEIGVILVAKNDRAVLGMVNILYTVSTALGARVALLEDMIVTQNARGEGIGSRLIERAIAVARENGCKRITLLTDRTNVAAHRFYGRYGFELSSMVSLRLQLE